MTEEPSFPHEGRGVPPALNPIEFTIYITVPSSTFIDLAISEHYPTHLTVFSSDQDLPPGSYTAHPYLALANLHLNCQSYAVYPRGQQPKIARNRTEVEAAYPHHYAFCSHLPRKVNEASILFQSRARASSLKLDFLEATTFAAQGVSAQLVFRSPFLNVHNAPGVFTLISGATIPPTLNRVLTSV